ncbi:hypothetical protein Sjap_002694 [Stephania japonica]|uniref:WPP domain-associated protein n=1 Tax=Stephania japonica TaxID=461633 RepID=A0AAP0PUS1_9MAGN
MDGSGAVEPPSLVSSMGSDGSEGVEGADILHDLDSYLQEINDRLTISRMVSDSVVKGMVNAVTEEAAARIAQAEAEAVSLKERLRIYEMGGGGRIGESGLSRLKSLRMSAEEQFQLLKGDVDDGGNSKGFHVAGGKLSKVSGSLGQNELNEYASWLRFDQNLSILNNIMNAVFDEVGNVVSLSKISHYEWQKEREFQDEIEAMVIRNSVRGFRDELQGKLLEQSALFYGGHKKKQLGKMKQLSGLRQELDALSRSLSSPEIVHLPPYMSHEDVEKKDHFHRKALSNHLSPPDPIQEVNGNHGTAKNITAENSDPAQLKHMSKDELIAHFKNEMTKMKRNHESFVQELTEDYFSLRREYLKETGRSSSLKKDKEFEALRKKIPDVIVTLDDILTDNEKVSLVHENDEIIDSLRCRIDSLVSANYGLKEMLKRKEKEVEFLLSQLSSVTEEMSHNSLSKDNLSEQMEELECDLQVAKMEVSIREDIYGCFVRGLMDKIKWHMEDMDMESLAVLEFCQIVFTEAVKDGLDSTQRGVDDSDLEFILMQELRGVILEGTIKSADAAICLGKRKYEEEFERRVSLEASVSKIQKVLTLEVEEMEKLNREMLLCSSLMEENKKLENLLLKENERFELMNHEYTRLRDLVKMQAILIDESSRELDLLNSKLVDSVHQKLLYEGEISKLHERLELARKDQKEANEDRVMMQAIIEEKEGALALFKAKEIAHHKEIESIIVSVERLLRSANEFEIRAVKAVENNNMRLEELKSEYIRKANSFKRMELVYKQRLERKSSDHQKAEAEVDLLGDEVDVLLGLLEKIYIALDHYAPILKHYPGIMALTFKKRKKSALLYSVIRSPMSKSWFISYKYEIFSGKAISSYGNN